MNIKYLAIGLVFILIGIWFYTSLSSFKIEEGSSPKSIVISEGIERTDLEVARALSNELGFDIEGAFKTGYTPRDVIEYLIKEPHKYSFTFYNGRYYEGRTTILHMIPFSVCIGMVVIGVVILLFKSRSVSGKS